MTSSKRILAAHQLHFMPWLRYVEKALRADVFVVLDDVQFNKSGWQNRNKVKGPRGWYYLTVPVRQRLGQRLDEVEIDRARDWRKKHVLSLKASYGRAPHFASIFPRLDAVYAAQDWRSLNEFNWALLGVILELVSCSKQVLRSSALGREGEATARLIDLCRKLGADTYLSGAYAATQYLDVAGLAAAGVEVRFQSWMAPAYAQVHPAAGFVPDLAVIDLLMAAGSGTRDVLLSAGGFTVTP
jgi:hypothetical protein